MKGRLTVNIVIILILAVIALGLAIAFYSVSGKESTTSLSLENERREFCSAYVQFDAECNKNEDGIAENDAPANVRIGLIKICQRLNYNQCTGLDETDPNTLPDACTQNCCKEFCKS